MTFDLDAVAREAKGEPFEFTFGGEKYRLPPKVDIAAVAALEGGQLLTGLSRLLGQEQWDRVMQSDAVLDETVLLALLEEYGKHVGIPMGESSASTAS